MLVSGSTLKRFAISACGGSTATTIVLADNARRLPPILIEVQSIVNEAFMERLVKYSQSAKKLYKTYSLVMVFCINKLSPLTFITKFTPVDGKPWMQRSLL
jgi:hypothetical protein